jgi:hypothetical protein
MGEKVVIKLKRYGSNITEGQGRLILREALDKSVRERARSIRKGEGDL